MKKYDDPSSGCDFALSEEQIKQLLEEQHETIKKEMRAATGNEKKLKLLEHNYNVIIQKIAYLQRSCKEKEELLKKTSEDLERIRGNMPDNQLIEADEKLKKGIIETAEHVFDAVISRGDSTSTIALAAFRSGTLAEDRVDYEKALRQYKKAAVLEEENPKYLVAAGRMACILAEYQMAQDWFEKLLKIRKAEKEGNTNLAFAFNNLACLYHTQGCYKEAEPLYKRCLSIFEQSQGKDQPEIASTLTNLAKIYVHKGHYKKAEQLYQQVLSIYTKFLGEDHLKIVSVLNNLATLFYRHQRRYDEAEPLFKRCLEITENALGGHHPCILTTLHRLMWLYYFQGRYKKN